MPSWLNDTFSFLLVILPGGLWMAFWFFAVNWKRVWPVLAAGAWMPFVLLILITATVWSSISPSSLGVPGMGRIGNFWWQLCSCIALAAAALFSGWLQGISGYEPVEVPLEGTAEASHDNGHH